MERLGGLAQELLGHESTLGFGEGPAPDAREIESRQGRRALPCPIEADASQTEAVALAKSGRSFVLEGPPGTGKSQTIANLVAVLIAEGRRVLFCAEKRAAIEAVAKRLEECGLVAWVLDLHGRTSGPEGVRAIGEALERAYAKDGAREPDEAEDDPTDARDALNAHVEALHRPRAWGVSVYGAMGRAGRVVDRLSTAGPRTAGETETVEDRLDVVRTVVLAEADVPEERWETLRRVCCVEEGDTPASETARALSAEAGEVLQRDAAAREMAKRVAPGLGGWLSDLGRSRRRARKAEAQRAEALAALTVKAVGPGCADLGLDAVRGIRRWPEAVAMRIRANTARVGKGAWLGAVEKDHGYAQAVEKLRAGDRQGLEELCTRIGHGWWADWCTRWIRGEPVLERFLGRRHEERLARFAGREDAWQGGGAVREVERRCRAALSLPEMHRRGEAQKGAREEVRFLRKEAKKKRRTAPMRTVFAEAGGTLGRLKPCVMLSPLDAARVLPAGMKLDAVVMDEASQIRPEDAIGVIARAKQVVLAGDPKQMPPTSFFEREASEEDGEDPAGGLESILDVATAQGMPVHRLEFHYRSRHESLIAFSNRAYYGGRLVTFPDPGRGGNAVEYVPVEGAVYEAQRNVPEAKRVAERVAAHVKGPEGASKSIGVVTFNRPQQRLVEDLLDKLRIEDEALEAAWRTEGREAPCVRNLETAQGDERDVVVLSTTFGPDAGGRRRNHYGPLNREGGERRLNVAVTRARERMVVVTSLEPESVGTAQSPRGVRDLAAFLRWARDGRTGGGEETPGRSEGGYESPLEEQIAQSLEARGWELVPQVGYAGYRIDMGVVDPADPSRYLAGIEADGAMYHSARTARDRDRLRQRQLEAKGWTLLRVWSPDWWRDPDAVAERLDGALRRLTQGAGIEGGRDV